MQTLPVERAAVAANGTAEDVRGLPAMVDRAAHALMGARSSAEILEAQELAGAAYDTAKRAARVATAKRAHDSLVAAAHRAQADALEIESAAKRRLADEYDAAQDAGEVQSHGGQGKRDVPDENIPSTEDLGFTRKAIYEARRLRDAEVNQPGVTRDTLDEMLANGEEPTRAALRRGIEDEARPSRQDDDPVARRRKPSKLHTGLREQHRNLMRAWKDAAPEARERFLRDIGATVGSANGEASPQ